ncbi:MAG: replicative DNA helicase [Oscillospiraceae bacterium]|nr:replicative DNA helicase [Oscillospiraceae bacterium]
MPVNNLSAMDLGGRELPYSLEAEQTVLGALLLNPDALPIAIAHLKPESFYRDQHRELYSIILRMFSNGQRSDIITVMNEAVNEKVFETPEMAKVYLKGIMDSVPSTSNIESYCKIVEDKYLTRSLINASREILDTAMDGSEDSKTLLDMAEQKIYEIRQGREVEGLTRLSDIVVSAYDHIQKLSGDDKDLYKGLSSGFSLLDSYISGLNKSDLIIVAARPGMGKSAFAFNVAANVAKRSPDKTICAFSLEMSKEQLGIRMLSSEALVPNTDLASGKLTPEDWIKLAGAAESLSKMNIYIDDTAGITVPQIKAKLRRMRNLGLVIIDYLQLMESTGNHASRVNEVSEITRQIKLMAKELDVPVMLLSQLNRSVEGRQDHRPLPSDLRESGSIEQDADIILFIYREGVYNKEAENQAATECIVSKNRHGATGTVPLAFIGEYTLFRSTTRDNGDA